jgi:hypothetical protein
MSMFMLLFIFVLVCDLFEWKKSVQIYYFLFIAVGDSIIKRDGCDPIYLFAVLAVLFSLCYIYVWHHIFMWFLFFIQRKIDVDSLHDVYALGGLSRS